MKSTKRSNQKEKSRFPRPNLVGNLPDKLELPHHVVVPEQVALCVTRKPTLRADTEPLQRLLARTPRPTGHHVRSRVHPCLHLLLILELGELARQDAQDDVFVLRQVHQRLEAAGARRVVLEVVRVDVQGLEELDGDAVVAALGEVARVYKVAAAEVDADVHVRRAGREAGVVEGDVRCQQLGGGLRVGLVLLPTVEHLFRAEVFEGGVSVLVSVLPLFVFHP